uniref:Dynein axonemal assembly factor 3 n=1 Tax=Tetraodon nigroviridis TaxID=99883 RepID=H3DCK0_TETNG
RMSAGRLVEGPGCITWWGFSPACDLMDMEKTFIPQTSGCCLGSGPGRLGGEANVLLVGSADPRHFLKTLAGLQDTESLHVWVVESSMEVAARQLLLLYLALMPQEIMGNNEKTEVFLELFGNSEIRSQTAEMLKCAASQLSLSVTETQETPTHSCLNTAQLKFLERDQLAKIFQTWLQPQSSASALMPKAWDHRVRQHLGTRYDCKGGSFDWDVSMKLHEKGCGLIHKHQYVRWRETGLAFERREGTYQITNPTLISSRVFNQGGNRVAVRGYWGDIVSSPYLAFGIETHDKSLLQKQNGQHVKTAQDVSFANVQTLFQALCARRACSSSTAAAAEPSDRKGVSVQGNRAVPAHLMHPNGVAVTFLSTDSLDKLPGKQKYSHFFNAFYFSTSCAHQLGPMLRQIAAPDAVLVVELANRYILDLNREQEAGFERKVASIALEAGFEP